jgi:predicted transcriptional regulator
MERHPHLNGIEGMAMAIRAVNKRFPKHLTYKGFRILVSLYHATERGQVISRRQLLERLVSTANVDSYTKTERMLQSLKASGYLEYDRYGVSSVITITVAGRNYIRSVETYLRNIRWRDMRGY